MIKNYFKVAWRNISRHRANTTINVLGLALGICSSLIIFLIVNFEMSYDTFHPDKKRIYRIVATQQDAATGETGYIGGTINSLAATMGNELTGFDHVTTFYNYYAGVAIKNNAGQVLKKFDPLRRGEEASPIIITGPQYFDLFKYQWLEGNPAAALKEPFKVVLSEKEANKYFGQEQLSAIIGKTILYKDAVLNDSLTLTVSGVVKDWDKNTDFGFKDFVSFATVQQSFLKKLIQLDNWGNWNPGAQGFVKLVNGVTKQQVERQFQQFADRHIPPYPGHKTSLSLQPLSDIHFNSSYRDSYSRKAHLPTLYGLMGIAAFILVIAIINFINLSTAQSLHRAKEIGVRKVLGSSRKSLVLQFLIETFLITLCAVILSVAITFPILKLFGSMIPVGVTLNLLNPFTLIFLAGVTFITSLLAGFYPARVLSSYLPVLSLKGQGAQKLNGSSRFRKILIVFQFTVSLVFIISTIVIGDQIHYILNKDLGFNKDAIVTFYTGWNNPADRAGLFADRVRQMPGVSMVSTHMETPAAQRHANTNIKYVSRPEGMLGASYEVCDENYVPLYGLKIIAGRNIRHKEPGITYLINETCARALGFAKPDDAIGKTVQTGESDLNDGKGTVVGVVKDFHSNSLHEPITPFFINSNSANERAISIKLATRGKEIDNFKKNMAQIEKAWKEFYPNEKFEYHFFDETIARLYQKEQETASLMNTAMIIAIFISCMGLFGLATFTAQQRLKEIGIRKVLGASARAIVAMLSKDFLRLVTIAILIASPVAYYCMHQWLQDFAYRINISWWMFLLAGSGAVLIALITIGFQTIKAALSNPVKSLRSE